VEMTPQRVRRTKTLWIRDQYLSQILAGQKTVEVRVGYENIRRLQPGDLLKLNDRHVVVVRRIASYTGFEDLVAAEDPTEIAPDLPSTRGSSEAASALLAALREIYPPHKEALGAVALEVELRRYDAILFDMGYTLIYFEPPQELIVQDALQEAGAERSTEEIRTAVDAVWGEYYRDEATATFPAPQDYERKVESGLRSAFLRELGLGEDPDFVERYSQSLQASYNRPGVVRPYPEVEEVLISLQRQGYRLGIVSNWSWNLRERATQVGLDRYFEIIWASAYAGCNKPHPGIFAQALEQMDLPAERALYVGDSYEHDVVGARSAGLEPVLVDRDGTAGEPNCAVIRDLRGVLDLLDSSGA
jgi:putative hydrolase of the HAD superfamily